jgi:hypothetical protein
LDRQSLVDVKWLIKEWDEISKSIYEVFGSGGALVLRYIGEGIGRGYAENVRRPADLSLQKTLCFIQEYFEKRALGKIVFSEIRMEKNSGKIMIQGTPLQNPYSRFILYGIISGFLRGVTGKKASVREVENDFPNLMEATFHIMEGEI